MYTLHYIHTYMYMHTQKTLIHKYMYMCTQAQDTQWHTSTQTHIHVHVHVCMHESLSNIKEPRNPLDLIALGSVRLSFHFLVFVKIYTL